MQLQYGSRRVSFELYSCVEVLCTEAHLCLWGMALDNSESQTPGPCWAVPRRHNSHCELLVPDRQL